MNDSFDKNCKDTRESLEKLTKQIDEVRVGGNERRGRLNNVTDEIQRLLEEMPKSPNVSTESLKLPEKLSPYKAPDDWDELTTALGVIPEDRRRELEKQFFKSVPPYPPFDSFDIFLLVALGGMALLADFLLVGLPPKTKWVPKNEGGVIPTGWLSERLKSWQVGDDNWLARLSKVPFDKSTLPNTDAGLNPFNHRLLTFGHDPSPIGMVFGLMDIVSGGMSGITREGQLFNIPGIPPSAEKILMSPLIWLGHLASDVATPMGLPIPCWSLTQILRFPAPGSSDGATIADVCRIMYERGYDFRHYLAGGTEPALIEIIIRTYHFLRYSYPMEKEVRKNVITANLAENYIEKSQLKGHLSAMLFWAHTTAAAINAGKVVIQGTTGDYFSAVRAINIAQWQAFALRAVEYMAYCLRDKKFEQIGENRKKLNGRWDALSAGSQINTLFETAAAPKLIVMAGGEA